MTRMLGLSIALCATPWVARSDSNASMQVSLTIRESCLIHTSDESSGGTMRPHVSCLHGSPHLARLIEEPAAVQGASQSAAHAAAPVWLIMF